MAGRCPLPYFLRRLVTCDVLPVSPPAVFRKASSDRVKPGNSGAGYILFTAEGEGLSPSPSALLIFVLSGCRFRSQERFQLVKLVFASRDGKGCRHS